MRNITWNFNYISSSRYMDNFEAYNDGDKIFFLETLARDPYCSGHETAEQA